MTHCSQNTSNDILISELGEIQTRTHDWGRRNQVEFDAGKEGFKIIHPSLGVGEDFKLLGTLLDCCLSMKPCIDSILARVRPKVRALLRLKDMYPTSKMLEQYKTRIWGLKEYSNGAIIIAAPTQLQRLDKVQRWFLHELGMTDTEAFVVHNLAPPSIRRSIGILGFLHKRVLGHCHPLLCTSLPFAEGLEANYHSKALDPQIDGVNYQHRLYARSLYGYILMYNRLPQCFVDAPSVKSFQAKLTQMAKHQAQLDQSSWRKAYQSMADIHNMFYG